MQMIVSLVPITIEEFPVYSELAFHGDIDMQTKYGTIQPLETPAERNCKNVVEAFALYPTMEFYRVQLENGEEKIDIGFTATLKLPPGYLLYSFGINIEYRKGEILREWLAVLDKQFGENYTVLLFLRNTRAIKFFTKNGFVNNRIDEKDKGILMWR